jgi:iron-sulfur cluster assembly protein
MRAEAVLGVTDRATAKIRELVGEGGGVRVKVGKKGCSGLSYDVSEGEGDALPFEEVIELGDVKVFVDPGAVMFLLGSCMDVEEDDLGWKFIFSNPNEKGRCGCGMSFFV